MDKTIISVKNDLSQLSLIVEKLEEIANSWSLASDTLFNINLVIEELFTNIVFYGFSDKDEHDIIIRISRKNGVLEIEIEDDGREFNPFEAPEPDHIDKPLEERDIGGLGIHFVRSIMDEVGYKRIDDKNILTLKLNYS